MSPTEGEASIKRILVAVDASPSSLMALEAAAELAASLEAEVLGLFIEDINLLRLGEVPFAREVGFSTGSIREVDIEGIQRQLRAQASRARKQIFRLAQSMGFRWSFRVARGVIDRELLEAALDADLVILGRRGWSGSRRLGSTAQAVISQAPNVTMIMERRVKLEPTVLVLYDGSALAQKALRMAADLVQKRKGYLTVAILAMEEEEAKRLQTEVGLWLHSQHLQARYRWMMEEDDRLIAELVRSEGGCMLVLPGEIPMLQGEHLRAVVDRLQCPVMVVR
jgi:nucleotide-binding universal stress UspA family protein